MTERIKTGERVEIPLYRGGAIVTSLPGCLGAALRETRITALLGYLLSLAPDQFYQLLGLRGRVLTIGLETYHEQDRSDILIETTRGNAVVEAKLGATDPFRQVRKYKARWRVLITNHQPTANEAKRRRVRFVDWARVGEKLCDLTTSRNAILRFLSENLLDYLEEHNMVRARDSVEIYAREINEEITLRLFLKAALYGCEYQKRSPLAQALYFAPHFGRWVARSYPGVSTGISYIAKIETVKVVDTWEELLTAVRTERGKTWLRLHREYLQGIRKEWRWTNVHRRSFLFLGAPRLVFNPPIKKTNLQTGSGWLSRRTFSFEDFFEAWEK